MNKQQFDRLVAKMDQQIMYLNRNRRAIRFKGVDLIQVVPSDGAKTRSLIANYNQKARSYNALGGTLGRIIQSAVNQYASRLQPQDDLLGVIDELVRMRMSRHQSLLHDVEPQVYYLEKRMKDAFNGTNGIRDLGKQISDARRNKQ